MDPSSRGSRLDADHPENGVLIPCRFTPWPGGGPPGRGYGTQVARGSLGGPPPDILRARTRGSEAPTECPAVAIRDPAPYPKTLDLGRADHGRGEVPQAGGMGPKSPAGPWEPQMPNFTNGLRENRAARFPGRRLFYNGLDGRAKGLCGFRRPRKPARNPSEMGEKPLRKGAARHPVG